MSRPLRIGIVAPPWFEIPPRGYGGIEAMAYSLVEGLVDKGHAVTLIGAGEKHTRADFITTYQEPPSKRLGEPLPEVVHAAGAAHALEGLELDVIHDHTLAGPLLAVGRNVPTVMTAHGPMEGEIVDYYRYLAGHIHLVAISKAQQRPAPDLPWLSVVYNSVDVTEYPFNPGERDDYALFLGRMSPEKAPHLAIQAARAAGVRIVLAAKMNEPREKRYFKAHVEPLLGEDTEWFGEADAEAKKDLLSKAKCLLFPIEWEEPFGMVMLESMACGTPVVALDRGSVGEVVVDGTTGWICASAEELPNAIAKCDQISPEAARDHVALRFDVERMVSGYESVYRHAMAEPPSRLRSVADSSSI